MYEDILNKLRQAANEPEKGLPEEIFLFVSEMVPLVNTDLLVRDSKGRILLAWRKDKWWGSGWHVPGGVMRLNETFRERIDRTALEELHSSVTDVRGPIEVVPIINRSLDQRSHHVTLVYECDLPKDYVIDNGDIKEIDTGFLAWHNKCPADMLKCHEFYRKYFRNE